MSTDVREMMITHKIFVIKPEMKSHLTTSRRRWDLKEIARRM
jgi:hypothetical protein